MGYTLGTEGGDWAALRYSAEVDHYDVIDGGRPGPRFEGAGEKRSPADCVRCAGMVAVDKATGPIGPSEGGDSDDGSRRGGRRGHLGSRNGHGVVTSSAGGSREALLLVMERDADILLVHEHRIAGPGLPGVRAVAMGMTFGIQRPPKEPTEAEAPPF